MICSNAAPKQVIVATEASDFQQAIYVDGLRRWEGGTAVALDIVTAAGNGAEAIALRCVNVDLPEEADGFPETLDELRPLVSPVDEPIDPITPYPLRIQRRRTKGFRLPHGATSVARPGRWGIRLRRLSSSIACCVRSYICHTR